MGEAEGGAPTFIGALGTSELSPGTCRVALLPCCVRFIHRLQKLSCRLVVVGAGLGGQPKFRSDASGSSQISSCFSVVISKRYV